MKMKTKNSEGEKEDILSSLDATFSLDTASVVRKHRSVEEKSFLLNMHPCQPPEFVLSGRQKTIVEETNTVHKRLSLQ